MGTPLVEPPPLPTIPPMLVNPLVPPPAPVGAPPPGPAAPPALGAAAGPDPNLLLMQSMLAAQAKTWSDQYSAQMALQQMNLQAATLRSNTQQLANLGSYMSNIGMEVGQGIASNSA